MMATKKDRKTVGIESSAVTEDMVLEMLLKNRGKQYKRGHAAQRLNCSAAEIRPHLDALVGKGLIKTTCIGPHRVYFAPLDEVASRPNRIVGKGELSGDYNGALRHMRLCMEVRRP